MKSSNIREVQLAVGTYSQGTKLVVSRDSFREEVLSILTSKYELAKQRGKRKSVPTKAEQHMQGDGALGN